MTPKGGAKLPSFNQKEEQLFDKLNSYVRFGDYQVQLQSYQF